MATNFRNSAGTDFDSLFAPNQSGQYTADSGFRTSDGTDLSRRYEVMSYGSKGADVSFRTSAGTDVSTLWAAYGTAVYALPFNGYSYSAGRGGLTGETGQIGASRSISIMSDGKWSVGGSGGLGASGPTSGTWLPSGQSASDWQVLFEGSPYWDEGSRYGNYSNGASSYMTLTSSYSCGISCSVRSDSVQSCLGSIAVKVALRRLSTGQTISSTIYLQVAANGWV